MEKYILVLNRTGQGSKISEVWCLVSPDNQVQAKGINDIQKIQIID